MIDYLNEIEIKSKESLLSCFDIQTFDFPFNIDEIRKGGSGSFGVSSKQTIKAYAYIDDWYQEVFECISSGDDEFFKCFDISPRDADLKICAILENSKKMTIYQENYRYTVCK